MTYFEIYTRNDGTYEIWRWTGGGAHGERFKVFKTKTGAENWAARQWLRVIWR